MISLLALTFMKTPPPRARRCSPVSRMQFLTHSSSTASVNFCTPPAIASKDRKSTRLNSSHSQISDAAFCLEKISQIDSVDQHAVGVKVSARIRVHAYPAAFESEYARLYADFVVSRAALDGTLIPVPDPASA